MTRSGRGSAGARTPEELETLLEDVLMIQDRDALAGLFEDGAVLVAENGEATRGGEIAGMALETWRGERAYIADPRQVMQARDIALIVSSQGINVMRRGRDGAWRYAIAVLTDSDEQEEP